MKPNGVRKTKSVVATFSKKQLIRSGRSAEHGPGVVNFKNGGALATSWTAAPVNLQRLWKCIDLPRLTLHSPLRKKPRQCWKTPLATTAVMRSSLASSAVDALDTCMTSKSLNQQKPRAKNSTSMGFESWSPPHQAIC